MAFLALNGGEKQRKKEFIKWPVFDEREVKAVTDVVNSGNWWRFAFGEGVNNEEKKEGDNRAQVFCSRKNLQNISRQTMDLPVPMGRRHWRYH